MHRSPLARLTWPAVILAAPLLLVGPQSAFAQAGTSGFVSQRQAGPTVEEASDAQKARAQEAFAAGDDAFDVQDYERALNHFETSFQTVGSPNSRLMIARSLLELGRLDEAYEEYAGVMSDAAKSDEYSATLETAKSERAALKSRLAWVTIHRGNVPDGATLMVGERPRSTDVFDTALPLNPGKTVIRATTSEGRHALVELHVAAGRSTEVTLEVGRSQVVGTPAPEPNQTVETTPHAPPSSSTKLTASVAPTATPANLRPWAYVAGGVGIAGFATFATFGVLSGNVFNDLEKQCPDSRCPAASQSDIDQGKQYQLFANIGLGVGIAGAVTSAVLFVLDSGEDETPLQVGVGPDRIQLQGAF